MKRIPDSVPNLPLKSRLTNTIAVHLPKRIIGPFYVSLYLHGREITPGVHKVTPWITLYVDRGDHTKVVNLVAMQSKVVELWDPDNDPWLEYPDGAK